MSGPCFTKFLWNIELRKGCMMIDMYEISSHIGQVILLGPMITWFEHDYYNSVITLLAYFIYDLFLFGSLYFRKSKLMGLYVAVKIAFLTIGFKGLYSKVTEHDHIEDLPEFCYRSFYYCLESYFIICVDSYRQVCREEKVEEARDSHKPQKQLDHFA